MSVLGGETQADRFGARWVELEIAPMKQEPPGPCGASHAQPVVNERDFEAIPRTLSEGVIPAEHLHLFACQWLQGNLVFGTLQRLQKGDHCGGGLSACLGVCDERD